MDMRAVVEGFILCVLFVSNLFQSITVSCMEEMNL